MRRLLSANFARLWKSKLFYLGIAVLVGFDFIYISDNVTMAARYHIYLGVDSVLFWNGQIFPIALAVLIGFFIGTEYSDGTIRNKLMVGFPRSIVYLANFIVSYAAALLLWMINMLVVLCIGGPLLGRGEATAESLLFSFVCSLATIASFTAIFLFFSMLIQSKATGSVVVILLSIIFLCLTTYVEAKLQEPEFYEDFSLDMDEDGNILYVTENSGELIPNPDYLRGFKRQVYEFLNDFQPYSQMYRIAVSELESADVIFIPYSLAIVVIFTAGGILLFRKKDLK